MTPKRVLSVFFVLFVMPLLSCSSEIEAVSPNSPTQGLVSQTASLANMPFSTSPVVPVHRDTPIPPTATDHPTSTPPFQFEVLCPEMLSSQAENFNRQGVLVLSGNGDKDFTFLNVKTGTQQEIWSGDGDGLNDYQVSTNRQWLANTRVDWDNKAQSELVIVDAQGNISAAVPWDERWFMVSEWIDKRLLVSDFPGEDSHAAMTLLNPFTGERQQIRSNFPDLHSPYPYLSWEGFQHSLSIYNPALSLVIFPRVQSDGTEQLVLWDIPSDQELHAWPVSIYLTVTPQWSPEGAFFVANSRLISTAPTVGMKKDSTNEELFLFYPDGRYERLTYFTQYYENVSFSYYRWSPDGRFLAFWVNIEGESFPDLFPEVDEYAFMRLALLDLETKAVTHTCLPGDFSYAPIWSPDGKQVAFSVDYGRDLSIVVLYDVEQNTVLPVAVNKIPVGWMIDSSEP